MAEHVSVAVDVSPEGPHDKLGAWRDAGFQFNSETALVCSWADALQADQGHRACHTKISSVSRTWQLHTTI